MEASSGGERSRWWRVLAPAVAGSLALLALPVGAQAVERSCGWQVQITGDQVNALFPDEAAKYWVSVLPIQPGGHIELRGRYPRARYLSVNTYTSQTQAIDAIADVDIAPEPGSSNPFLPGADRTGDRRDYTIRVLPQQAPADASKRERNAVYYRSADGSKGSTLPFLVSFALRVYRPDRGRDITGGVGLPKITSVGADGRRTEIPLCPPTDLPDLGTQQTTAAAGVPVAVTPPGLSANSPPVWRKYVNAQTSIVNGALGGDLTPTLHDPAAAGTMRAFPSGGFGENLHNKYVQAFVSTEHGSVVVLRGRLPRTPATFEGQPGMGTGDMRYWSLCSEAQTSNYYGCLSDDQIPVDADGRYTIAVSTAAARPVNAEARCGVAWLPAGPVPQTLLLLRNMLPEPRFTQSVQATEPGRERQTMGEYLPVGTYHRTRAAADEALGCAPPLAGPGSPVALDRCTSRRTVRITLPRGATGGAVRRVEVRLDGRRTAILRGARRSVVVSLKGRPKARVRVQLRVLRKAAGPVTVRRQYRTCMPRRPS